MTKPKAPRPGVGKRADATAKARKIVTVSYRGEVHTLAHNMVPVREKLAYLDQVGKSYEKIVFADELFSEAISTIVWLSYRANGFPGLTFDQFLDEHWPADLTIDEITMRIEEPAEGASDPEA